MPLVNDKMASHEYWEVHELRLLALQKEIDKIDWYHEMSDDHRVFTRGEAQKNKVIALANSIGSDGLRLWKAHLDIHYSPAQGFSYRPEK